MPKPRERNRTSRKITFTTPGGNSKTVYQEKTTSTPHCAQTGKALHGVDTGPKTHRRPERPYGGVLISEAARRKHINTARANDDIDDADGYAAIGRVCIKTAGRDAGKRCVIIDQPDNGEVLIDGETRRRTVKLKHLEPTSDRYDIAAGASHAQLKETLDFPVRDTEPRDTPERPKKEKIQKEPPEPSTEPEEQDTVEAVKDELGDGKDDTPSIDADIEDVDEAEPTDDTELTEDSDDEPTDAASGDAEEIASDTPDLPARSTIENKTKDELKRWAGEEYGVELSTDDLKDEMIDQLIDEVE